MPVRVLQVIASLQGGAAQHLLLLAGGLRQRGVEVDVVSPDDEAGMARKFREAGCGFSALPLDRGLSPNGLIGLEELMADDGYGIVHAHGLRAGAIVRLVARITGRERNTVFTIHGFHVPHYTNPLARKIAALVERRESHWAARVICVSQADRQAYVATCGNGVAARTVVIPNGIDAEAMRTEVTREGARRRFGVPENAGIVGTAARLRRQKDIPTLLRAFALFRQKHPNSRLLIAGDGPLKGQLAELAGALGLKDVVHFPGVVQDMPVFYRALDYFCLPSLWEGWPLSLMEAMSAGVPVVATEVAGNTEVISNLEDGLLVPASDPESMEKALHCLATNPAIARKLAARARDRVCQELGAERMVDRTLEVYSSLAGERFC